MRAFAAVRTALAAVRTALAAMRRDVMHAASARKMMTFAASPEVQEAAATVRRTSRPATQARSAAGDPGAGAS
jgi:hypothetical protein